jgi:hypothetical protein
MQTRGGAKPWCDMQRAGGGVLYHMEIASMLTADRGYAARDALTASLVATRNGCLTVPSAGTAPAYLVSKLC